MSDENDMLIVLDVGNTNMVAGAYKGDELVESFRVATAGRRTEDEYGVLFLELFERRGLRPETAVGVAISSVVPPLKPVLSRLSQKFFGRDALFIEPGVRTGLPIRYDNPTEVGADRIVNAVAARKIYGSPVVVVDFGTATTFDVLNAEGEYLGGIITPGIGISAEALFRQASRLYRVDIKEPADLVGRTTVGAMQSGLYYGYVGLVDGILRRLAVEMPDLRAVVATGGQASLIAEASEHITAVDDNLTLLGLKLIYELNR